MTAALWRGLRPLLLLPALLLVPAASAIAADDDEEGLPVLESGPAAVDLGTRRLTLRYSTTVLGPLIEVRPLIDELGGDLIVGPLGESHELTLNDKEFAFGPGSDALTSGQEIVDLSQHAVSLEGVVQVPLDLLDNIYGHHLGYEFTWNPAARMLIVRHQPERELDLQFNLVQVQGVTTAVFQFSTRPRYRIVKDSRSVSIELISDRLSSETERSTPRDNLVRGIDLSSSRIRLRLAAGVVAEEYVLDEPFRLVFDIFRGDPSGQQAEGRPRLRPRERRRPGIRTIVLDPGHGGGDTGAVGRSGLEEKRLTLQVARTLQRLLEERLAVRVILTRSSDGALPLETRAAVANQNKGDLFVSLHFNSAVGSGASGPETFFLTPVQGEQAEALSAAARSVGAERGDPLFDLQLQPWDRVQDSHLGESRALAQLVQDELNTALEASRRSRQAPLRVLAGVAMPAVLVEFGFLTNAEEEIRFQDPEYRFRLADAVAKGIARYQAMTEGGETVAEEADPS